MYVAPPSSVDGGGARGGGVKGCSGRKEGSGKKKEGKRWWVDSLFGKKKGKGGKKVRLGFDIWRFGRLC